MRNTVRIWGTSDVVTLKSTSTMGTEPATERQEFDSHFVITVRPKMCENGLTIAINDGSIVAYRVEGPNDWGVGCNAVEVVRLSGPQLVPPDAGVRIPVRAEDAAASSIWSKETIRAAERILGLRSYETAAVDEENDSPVLVRVVDLPAPEPGCCEHCCRRNR